MNAPAADERIMTVATDRQAMSLLLSAFDERVDMVITGKSDIRYDVCYEMKRNTLRCYTA